MTWTLRLDAATFLQCNAQPGYTTNGILLTEGFPTAFKVRNFAQIIANGTPPGAPGQFYDLGRRHQHYGPGYQSERPQRSV